MQNKKLYSSKKGFSLIELLVVIGIISVLTSAIIYTLNPIAQIQKATDAERKNDLSHMQRALEEYHNDKGQYPSDTNGQITNDLGTVFPWGTNWDPYMRPLPKDPSDPQKRYYYVSVDVAGQSGYVIYASLDRENDPKICNSIDITDNCPSLNGYKGGSSDYCGTGKVCNYGVASPNIKP